MEVFSYHHKKFDQRKRSAERSLTFKTELLNIDESDQPSTSRRSKQCGHFYYACSDISQKFSNDLNDTRHKVTSTPAKRKNRVKRNSEISVDYFIPKRFKQENEQSLASSTESSTTSRHLNSTAVTPPPATDILMKISDDTLRSICKYHGNMVRKFPKKERSPRDQDRRNKNTIACRMSRRVKKLEHIAIEEQYKEFSKQHFEIIEQFMRAAAYLNEIVRLSANTDQKRGRRSQRFLPVKQLGETAFNNDDEDPIICIDDEPMHYMSAVSEKRKSFSIAYIMDS